jgi:D-sedoheptulose 7-phosphate isomerase
VAIGAAERLARDFDAAVAARAAIVPALDACACALVESARALAHCFEDGATLWVLGSGAAAPDADHVAVEFSHPVIVGKRALPAVSLGGDTALLESLARPGDALLGISADAAARDLERPLAAARARGLATFALASAAHGELRADHVLAPRLDDPLLVRESHVTLHHLLWEAVQAVLESRERKTAALPADTAALYPFLAAPRPDDAETARALGASIAAKLAELAALRSEAMAGNAASLAAAARGLARVFAAGGTLLAFGNGGSSTDAAATAQLFASAGLRARSLAGDAALVTALANDVGFEAVFARQLAAFARPGDAAIAFSTSGSSENAIAALDVAKRRGLFCVGVAGSGGGRMAGECALDALLLAPSDSVHRIQEVQRTLVHLLWLRARGEAACAS